MYVVTLEGYPEGGGRGPKERGKGGEKEASGRIVCGAYKISYNKPRYCQEDKHERYEKRIITVEELRRHQSTDERENEGGKQSCIICY